MVDCAQAGASERIVAALGVHTPILCSGITMGTREAVRGYLGTMVGFYRAKDGELDFCYGVDQGIHMLLLSSPGLMPRGIKVTRLSNEVGPVFNMHAVCSEPESERAKSSSKSPQPNLHEEDALMELRNGNRSMVAAIVHQYDRCPVQISKVKFGLPDVDDPQAEYRKSRKRARSSMQREAATSPSTVLER